MDATENIHVKEREKVQIWPWSDGDNNDGEEETVKMKKSYSVDWTDILHYVDDIKVSCQSQLSQTWLNKTRLELSTQNHKMEIHINILMM